MKAIPLFSLELRRLLLSRLTWLIALLTLLSPLAGLTLYKPASAGTMLSMYLANPALAGGAAGGEFSSACWRCLSWTGQTDAGWMCWWTRRFLPCAWLWCGCWR